MEKRKPNPKALQKKWRRESPTQKLLQRKMSGGFRQSLPRGLLSPVSKQERKIGERAGTYPPGMSSILLSPFSFLRLSSPHFLSPPPPSEKARHTNCDGEEQKRSLGSPVDGALKRCRNGFATAASSPS